MIPPFSMDDFSTSLTFPTVVLVAVIGVVMGMTMNRAIHGAYSTAGYLYWQLASGIVFFLPLALLRAVQGAETWSRLLGTGVLWAIYVLAKYLGASVGRRYWQ
jgi:Na+-driven multidrug efflux pump